MNDVTKQALIKVPAVTLGFWVIKILATTLGETGGDTVTMTMLHADTLKNWGYLIGAVIFGAVLVALVLAQIVAKRFHPVLYWATIVASTTFGTTLADFADRSLGIGYTGGSLLLLGCVLLTLGLWYRSEGTVSVTTVSTRKSRPSTGSRSRSLKLWAPHSAIGLPTPADSVTKAVRWYSAQLSPWLPPCITGRACRGWLSSGSPSS